MWRTVAHVQVGRIPDVSISFWLLRSCPSPQGEKQRLRAAPVGRRNEPWASFGARFCGEQPRSSSIEGVRGQRAPHPTHVAFALTPCPCSLPSRPSSSALTNQHEASGHHRMRRRHCERHREGGKGALALAFPAIYPHSSLALSSLPASLSSQQVCGIIAVSVMGDAVSASECKFLGKVEGACARLRC